MSPFSTTYHKLIEGRSVRVYDMADYCGISAQTLYQILSGKRKPTTRDLVMRMSYYLELSPDQSSRLLDAFYRTRIGEEKYWQRKTCEDFLMTASLDYLSFSIQTNPASETGFRKPIEIAQTRGGLIRAMFSLFGPKTDPGKIRLYLPYDFEYLPFLLRTADSSHPGIEITQIGTFPASLSTAEEIGDYFASLHSLIRLFFSAQNYRTVMTASLSSGLYGLFPYFLCTDQGVVLISRNGEDGAVIRDRDLAALYRRSFDAQLPYCQPTLTKSGSIYELCAYFSQIQSHGSDDIYILNRQCCFAPLLSRSMIDKYLNPVIASQPGFKALGGREGVLRFLCSYAAAERSYLTACGKALYLCENGIRSFLETGIMYEFPSDCWLAMEPEDRATVVELLIENYETYPYRLTRRSLGDPETGFSVFCTVSEGYVQLRCPDGDIGLLSIENPRLLGLLQDYFSSVEQESIYPADEARQILQELLQTWKESLH